MSGVSLNGGPERTYGKAVKLNFTGDPKMLEMKEPGDTCQLIANTRERSKLQSTKMRIVGDLKNILTSDLVIQSLKFSQLYFCMLCSSISLL